MPTLADLVAPLILPALLAAVACVIPSLLPRWPRSQWAGPLALAMAFVAAYPLVGSQRPTFPPNSAGDWLFWLAIPVALSAGVSSMFVLPATVRAAVAGGTIGLAVYCVMQPATASRTPAEWWGLWAAIVVILTVVWGFADAALRSADAPKTALAGFTCILVGACLLIQMSGSLKYAHQGLAVPAGGFVALALLGMGLPHRHVLPGIALAAVGIVGTLLAISIEPLFVYVKVHNALLIAVAPVLLWVGIRWVRLPQARPWVRLIARLALPAIPVLLALTIAGLKAMRDMSAAPGDYDGW